MQPGKPRSAVYEADEPDALFPGQYLPLGPQQGHTHARTLSSPAFTAAFTDVKANLEPSPADSLRFFYL